MKNKHGDRQQVSTCHRKAEPTISATTKNNNPHTVNNVLICRASGRGHMPNKQQASKTSIKEFSKNSTSRNISLMNKSLLRYLTHVNIGHRFSHTAK
jgi:hypothetical protein